MAYMKKIFTILTMCLLALTAAYAQDAATYHLKVRLEPSSSLHFSMKCYDPSAQINNNGYFYGGT